MKISAIEISHAIFNLCDFLRFATVYCKLRLRSLRLSAFQFAILILRFGLAYASVLKLELALERQRFVAFRDQTFLLGVLIIFGPTH